MARPKKVVDASVLVKWFVDEPGSQAALHLREAHISGDIELVVPELAILEVCNALRYKGGTEETLKKAAAGLLGVQLTSCTLNADILEDAVVLALKHKLTVYDSLYLAIARKNKCALVTFDDAILKTGLAEKL